MLDVGLDHVVRELGRPDVEALGGAEPPAEHRVLGGVGERDQLEGVAHLGEVESGHPLDGGPRRVEGGAQPLGEGPQLGGRGHPVEASHLHVDRVDGPAAVKGAAGTFRVWPSLPMAFPASWLSVGTLSVVGSGGNETYEVNVFPYDPRLAK